MFGSRTRITLAGTGIAVALLVAGCGNNDSDNTTGSNMPSTSHGASSSAASARTDFNDADVSFLQMMYPHHAQAVDMAKLVPTRSRDQRLIALAANVEQAQSPEMREIEDLLRGFGKPAPTATMGHDMSGMMSHDQMTALANASGPEFDRMWLRMMIDHHRGAVEMSNTELASGANPDAKALAQKIIAAQQAEIQQMQTMLG
ncbi:DUF305 domain-containing protein [Nocardia sp. CDC159]|uniref:DUF305 domain-containing protein n=1 Tax=Nocardia pulmonis TaxID=2951408 RepID=A0A9X2EB78_9NOCA|nr:MULTISPECIES: DUF305 domain-containing protein [Nocardia]MCM6777096.1 DUF305 domain-containing protein [Nocardia pulmonis]MCM6789981.1 DUF305 domain-containing protein [Nocardia sp. CDC159]